MPISDTEVEKAIEKRKATEVISDDQQTLVAQETKSVLATQALRYAGSVIVTPKELDLIRKDLSKDSVTVSSDKVAEARISKVEKILEQSEALQGNIAATDRVKAELGELIKHYSSPLKFEVMKENDQQTPKLENSVEEFKPMFSLFGVKSKAFFDAAGLGKNIFKIVGELSGFRELEKPKPRVKRADIY